MKKWGVVLVGVIGLLGSVPAAAQTYQAGVKAIVDGLSARAAGQRVAVADFVDLSGNVTGLSRFLADEVASAMVSGGRVQVVGRAQLAQLLTAQRLSTANLADPAVVQRAGQLANAAYVLTGTVTDLGETVRVNARLISAANAQVAASATTNIAATGQVVRLLVQVLVRAPGGQVAVSNPPAPTAAPITAQALGLSFTVEGCRVAGDQLSCTIAVRNPTNNDVSMTVYNYANSENYTAIYNLAGTRIPVDSITYGGNEFLGTAGWDARVVVAGVTARMVLNARVPASADLARVSLLRLTFQNNISVQLRNIPVTR